MLCCLCGERNRPPGGVPEMLVSSELCRCKLLEVIYWECYEVVIKLTEDTISRYHHQTRVSIIIWK